MASERKLPEGVREGLEHLLVEHADMDKLAQGCSHAHECWNRVEVAILDAIEGKDMMSVSERKLEVSAGEALREAHQSIWHVVNSISLKDKESMAFHAQVALAAAVAAARREEREKLGHVRNCECHVYESCQIPDCCGWLSNRGRMCGTAKAQHVDADPRCEVKE